MRKRFMLSVSWRNTEVSQPKAALAVETAEAEHKLLSKIDSEAGDYIVYGACRFARSL